MISVEKHKEILKKRILRGKEKSEIVRNDLANISKKICKKENSSIYENEEQPLNNVSK